MILIYCGTQSGSIESSDGPVGSDSNVSDRSTRVDSKRGGSIEKPESTNLRRVRPRYLSPDWVLTCRRTSGEPSPASFGAGRLEFGPGRPDPSELWLCSPWTGEDCECIPWTFLLCFDLPLCVQNVFEQPISPHGRLCRVGSDVA